MFPDIITIEITIKYRLILKLKTKIRYEKSKIVEWKRVKRERFSSLLFLAFVSWPCITTIIAKFFSSTSFSLVLFIYNSLIFLSIPFHHFLITAAVISFVLCAIFREISAVILLCWSRIFVVCHFQACLCFLSFLFLIRSYKRTRLLKKRLLRLVFRSSGYFSDIFFDVS